MKTLWDDMGLTNRRCMILHHDDLGLFDAGNRAYLALGYPTGSVMFPGAWATQIRTGDLGAHLTLTSEWAYPRMRPLTQGASLRDPFGYFWPTVEEAGQHITVSDAQAELRAQIEAGLALGIDLTHLDTHMGAVLRPDIAMVYHQLAMEYRLPAFFPSNLGDVPMPDSVRASLQRLSDESPLPKVHWVDSYSVTQEPRRDWYIQTLSNLGPGVYHFIHHAAEATPEGRQLPDWKKRFGDFEALQDAEVRQVLGEFTLLTYRQVRDAMRSF